MEFTIEQLKNAMEKAEAKIKTCTFHAELHESVVSQTEDNIHALKSSPEFLAGTPEALEKLADMTKMEADYKQMAFECRQAAAHAALVYTVLRDELIYKSLRSNADICE